MAKDSKKRVSAGFVIPTVHVQLAKLYEDRLSTRVPYLNNFFILIFKKLYYSIRF